MSEPPPPTPSAVNIWSVKRGAAAPHADRATVLAAMALAAYMRYVSTKSIKTDVSQYVSLVPDTVFVGGGGGDSQFRNDTNMHSIDAAMKTPASVGTIQWT